MILGGERGHDKNPSAPVSIHLGAAPLIGSPASPLEFGRFLLSSVGFHLLLGWAVATVGLHSTPSPERPLQVRLVEAETSKAAAPATPPSVQTRARQQTAPETAPEEGPAPNEIVPRDLVRFPSGLPEVAPARAARILDHIDLEERRRIASRPSAEELVKGVGLPVGNAPFPDVWIGNGENIGGPKAIGPRSVGGGGLAALPSGRLSSGPAMLDGSSGGAGPAGSATRGSARRLGAELTATLAPTITIGPRQGDASRGMTGRGGAAKGGRFAGADYGPNPPPAYPPLAREKGYEGTVYLRVQVKGNGKVGVLAIDRSSGYEILDRAAADSVREWTFLPAQKDGKPVTSWVLLPVKFMLK